MQNQYRAVSAYALITPMQLLILSKVCNSKLVQHPQPA